MNCQAEQRSGGPADALRAVGGPANGTKNLLYYIYENAIINGRFETACVQAMFLLILISVIECSDIAKLPGSNQSSTAFQLSAEFRNCMSGFHCNTNRDCLSGSLRIRIFRIPSEKAAVQSGTDDDHDPGRVITNYTTIQSLHLTNTYAGLVVTSLISETSIFLMREGSHLRTPAYRPQRYAVGENSTVCVKRILFRRSDGISDSWINSVIQPAFHAFFTFVLLIYPQVISIIKQIVTIQSHVKLRSANGAKQLQ